MIIALRLVGSRETGVAVTKAAEQASVTVTDIPVRQVMIESRIVEALDTFSRNLGFRLGQTDLTRVRGGGNPGQSISGTGATAAVIAASQEPGVQALVLVDARETTEQVIADFVRSVKDGGSR